MIVTEKKACEAWDVLRLFCPVQYINDGWLGSGLPTEKEVVIGMYRGAAMATHPDKGGLSEDFARVDHAKHVLLAWLGKPRPAAPEHKKKPCDYCHGEGFLYMPSRQPGSVGLRRTCPKCRGSGDADIDLHNP